MTYLTVPFFTYIYTVLPVWQPLLLVDLIALYLLIFKERFDPRTLIFWVAVVFILPFLGFALYLIWGCTLYTTASGERKQEADARYMEGEPDPVPEDRAKLTGIMTQAGADVYTAGNAVTVQWDRPEVAARAEELIRSARVSVYAEVNRIPGGEDGRRLVAAMADRAREGLDVRLITSTLWFGRTEGLRELREAGVKHDTFHRKFSAVLAVKGSDRGLRQIIVADGTVAMTGLGSAVTVEGRGAARLQRRFLADWEFATGERQPVPPDDVPAAGDCGVQAVPSGPDAPGMPMLHGYSAIISGAEERLLISLPYLIPNDEMYNSIKQAVISGTDVRLLIPARGIHWYQPWNSLAAANTLMEAGARVYFSDDAAIRCIAVADGRVMAMGTSIYNTRSLWADYSENVVVHSEDAAGAAEAAFMAELDRAVECHPEEYGERSFGDRVRIAVARLFMFLNRRPGPLH